MNELRNPSERGRPLTPRERQVFDLLQQGYQRLNIGAILGISLETVKEYIRRIQAKTGCATTLELVTTHRCPQQAEARKRDLRIQQSQLTHLLAAVNEELAILNEEQSHENEAPVVYNLSAHPGGLAGAHTDAHPNLVQGCR